MGAVNVEEGSKEGPVKEETAGGPVGTDTVEATEQGAEEVEGGGTV